MKDLSFEKAYLEETKSIVLRQIAALESAAEKRKMDILAQKQEIREEAKHSMPANLWSSDNFLELVEFSQFASQTSENITKYELNIEKIKQLKKLLPCPYFGRIDFKFEDEESEEKIYIGRHSVMDEDSYTMIVYDWRSPISSMFYRYTTGSASYASPAGEITGEISLKRQYEIKNGELKYFFDTDIEILDEFLKQLLSQNTSTKMKSIIETIQRDQDLVIRNMACDLLMVQGVAGSGKTSIALHRIAYLMYHGLKNPLSSNSIVIISPNTLFEEYISNVLPELGEDNVASYILDEFYEDILNRPFQHKNEIYELLFTDGIQWTQILKESISFKMSDKFINMLNYLNIPLNMPINEIFSIYKDIFNKPKTSVNCDFLPQHWEDILHFTKENLASGHLYYDDASALVYLYLKSCRPTRYKHIKQVVIDEAQDYYPIHFEILNLLFPDAQFTVIGDINQTIEKLEKLSFYKNIENILNKKKSTLVSMDKSFRCAYEILEFSSKFTHMKIDSFSRHSEHPKIYKCKNEHDYNPLLNEINSCKEKGYASISILCKSQKDAQALYERIKDQTETFLIENEGHYNLSGTLIMPIYLSKGLEFDAVLLWDVDSSHYYTPEDRQLLYIACTRALHRLSLFYYGTISPLCT